jgi:hypothetical protein
MSVNMSTKYSVGWRKFKETPLLHCHGNTEHLFIVDSYIYANNNKKGSTIVFTWLQ